jgi:hypothetical protein
MDRNSVFLDRDPYILDWLYLMIPYMSFYDFSKKFKFSHKIHSDYLTVLPKIASLRQKLTGTPYFFVMTLIFQISYT